MEKQRNLKLGRERDEMQQRNAQLMEELQELQEEIEFDSQFTFISN